MKRYCTLIFLLLASMQGRAKKPDSLDIKIGQMIMIGIEDRTGIQDGDPLLKELKDGKIGGVVVFEKNIAKTDSKDSLRSLIQKKQKLSFPCLVWYWQTSVHLLPHLQPLQ